MEVAAAADPPKLISVWRLWSRMQVVASFSQMKYRGNKGREYALSAALPVTAETTAAPKLQLRSGKQGALNLNITSHDHPNIGLLVLYPLGKALVDRLRRRQQDGDILP